MRPWKRALLVLVDDERKMTVGSGSVCAGEWAKQIGGGMSQVV